MAMDSQHDKRDMHDLQSMQLQVMQPEIAESSVEGTEEQRRLNLSSQCLVPCHTASNQSVIGQVARHEALQQSNAHLRG